MGWCQLYLAKVKSPRVWFTLTAINTIQLNDDKLVDGGS